MVCINMRRTLKLAAVYTALSRSQGIILLIQAHVGIEWNGADHAIGDISVLEAVKALSQAQGQLGREINSLVTAEKYIAEQGNRVVLFGVCWMSRRCSSW